MFSGENNFPGEEEEKSFHFQLGKKLGRFESLGSEELKIFLLLMFVKIKPFGLWINGFCD